MKPDLSINIAGIELSNPVMLASGTARYGEEISNYCDLNKVGAIIVKGIALRPTPGNPPPRICETPSGMLNAIGLPNIGVESFITTKIPYLRQFNAKVIVNIFGSTAEDYGEVAGSLEGTDGIHGIEVNISCPNVKEGGIAYGIDPDATRRVVRLVRKRTKLPVIVKLSPNVTDIAFFAKACEDEGADALSVINTLIGMSIDTKTWKPRLANVTGGLSGPAIRPVAVRMAWQVSSAVKIPVIGTGGITSADDAVEFFLAGAHAVAVGTANFIKPGVSIEIIEGLSEYLKAKGLHSIKELIGALRI